MRIEARSLGAAEAVRAPPWIDARAPADLIDEQIAEAGDDGLVGKPRLEPSAAGEQPLELGARYFEGIGAESGEQTLKRLPIPQQTHAVQLAQVAVAQLTRLEREDDAVVAMQWFIALVPGKRAGHAKVKQHDRRRIGRRKQPLAMARRSLKAPPAQDARKRGGAHAAQHAAVENGDFCDARAGVPREYAAKALDVR